MNKIEIGAIVCELRKKKGYNQEQLAELIGYTSRSSIAKVESGLVDLPLSKIYSLSNALDIPIYDLLNLKHSSSDRRLSIEDIRMVNKLSECDMAGIMDVTVEEYAFFKDNPGKMEVFKLVQMCGSLNVGIKYIRI